VLEVLEVMIAVNVTAAPLDAETAELSKAVVVGANVMVSVIGAEALLAKAALPAYLQVMEWVPTESVDVVKVATALLFSVPAPRVAVPSRKVTVPVGVPEVLDEIVAVNVTGAPLDAEAADMSKAAVVAAAAVGVMVSVTTADELGAKLESPP
jgi:hypothetical protein